MNSSLNYIFESVHPYDDVAVRFGKNDFIYHPLINLLNYQSCIRILLANFSKFLIIKIFLSPSFFLQFFMCNSFI